jgi:iron complex outermembrane recepter protein
MQSTTSGNLLPRMFRVVLLAGVGAAAMAPWAAAQAQDTDENADANEIIVTAQKRAENAQNVPISITALSTQDIAASGVTNVSDLRVAVPALNVTRGAGGFGLPRIRGLGATGQGNGIENPVAVYVDGVYYAASSGVLQSLFDTEQVAVLKGPQGTLFGRNATGGLIQINTLNPSLDSVRFKGELGYGNYDTFRGAGFASAPLSDRVAVSISGQWEKRNQGFGKNVFTGNDVQVGQNYSARAKLLWEPSDATRIVLAGDINGADDASPAFVAFGLNTQGVNVPTFITNAGGDPRYDILADVDPDLTARQRGASLSISHEFAGVTLKSITAYRRTNLSVFFDPDGTTTPTLRIRNVNFDKNFTQEINLISDSSGPFKWIVGGFYMNNDAGQNPGRTTGVTQANAVGTTNTGFADDLNNVTLKSWSVFAEGSYHLGSDTNLTGGIRYTSDKRVLEAGTTVVFNGLTNTTTTTTTPIQARTFNNVSWKISLDHRFSDQVLAYASYNRGFRAGTFVPQAARPAPVLEPETVDAYEIGIKTDLMDRKLRINLSGYYYDQSSVQVMQVIAGVQNVYSARGGAEIYGLDGDITLQVNDNLRLFGGFAYNHARYKSFTDAILSIPFPLATSLGAAGAAAFSAANYSYVDSATGNTVLNTTCQGTFVPPPAVNSQAGRDGFYRGRLGGNCLLRGDASGNRLQNSPDWTFSLGGNIDLPTSIGKFSLGGNLSYNGGYVGTPDERVTQGSFTVANASLTWRSTGEKLYVRVWGNNLTNAFYRTQIGASNSGDNGTAGAPRTYGATLGFDF